MSHRAIVHTPTVGIAPNGHPASLRAGSYEVVELDGVGDGVTYIKGPDGGDLMCINLTDPAISIVRPGEPFGNFVLRDQAANPGYAGYVVGECGHRVAQAEWDAGFRNCERCPS